MYEEAIKRARECDQMRKNNIEACRGELFGIPVSIKNNIETKGQMSNWGALNLSKSVAQEDGLLAKLVRLTGAIPFVKSNMPQCGMDVESYNRLYGRCKNPWNLHKTTGGSSGGEAGLVASLCSPLGIGTDIGGTPACACHNQAFSSAQPLLWLTCPPPNAIT